MRVAFLLLFVVSLAVGCVSDADYQPPAGHPAHAGSTDAEPPGAGDPFAVDDAPVEASASTAGSMPHHHQHGDHGHADSAQADADAASAYPLTHCPVTGAELGSMGPPVDVMLGDRVVRVCCPGCVATVEADPAQYLNLLDQAEGQAQDKPAEHGSHSKGGH